MRYRIIDYQLLPGVIETSRKNISVLDIFGLNINICSSISTQCFKIYFEKKNKKVNNIPYYENVDENVDEYNLSDIDISSLNNCTRILIYSIEGNKIRMLPICTSQQFKQIEREEKLNRILYV